MMHEKTLFLNKATRQSIILLYLEFTTRSTEKKQAELTSSKYVVANQVMSRASELCVAHSQHSHRILPMLVTRSYFCNCNDSELLQTGDSPLHTAEYINDKGERIWLKFDPSRPCTMFPTYESRCVL